ncbi:hypothetical protein BC833DRAFT_611568 [Globomyces pollinis-pini]|nr:hypothetical protein BC833DRAFT_611568 [Globomyces pollinis-pini]
MFPNKSLNHLSDCCNVLCHPMLLSLSRSLWHTWITDIYFLFTNFNYCTFSFIMNILVLILYEEIPVQIKTVRALEQNQVSCLWQR